jgi:hypothetical protein
MMKDDYFYQRENIPSIDERHMEQLLEHPPILCREMNCPEDSYTGRKCKCILSVFPHITHYEHYLELVKDKVESAFVDLIGKDN